MNDFGERLVDELEARFEPLNANGRNAYRAVIEAVRAANAARASAMDAARDALADAVKPVRECDSASAPESRLSSVSRVETPIASSGAGVDLKNALFTLRESELNDDPEVTLFSEERRAILAHIEEQAKKIAELEQRIYDNTFPF